MDLLSEVLLSLKISSTIIANWKMGTPWGFTTASFPAGYCFNVVKGEMWFISQKDEPIKLLKGDSVLVPMGGAYSLASSTDAPLVDLSEIWGEETFTGFDKYEPNELQQVFWGGKGEQTVLMSLGFEFKPSVHRDLLDALPDFIILRKSTSITYTSLEPAINFLIQDETNAQPGFGAIATQLAEIIIIGQIRAHILSTNEHPKGWLLGIFDPKVSKALAAIHRSPEIDWSVIRLASLSGMSRSSFAKHFQFLLGEGPIQYLNNWRIQLSLELLLTTKLSVTQIAHQVGFSSDRSFRRIFKQIMHKSPLTYRNTTLIK